MTRSLGRPSLNLPSVMMKASPADSTASICSSSSAQRRRPCDRCHAVKEKCRWPGGGEVPCERCSRVKTECRTNRPLGQAGRRPKLAAGNRLSLRRTSSVSSAVGQCPPVAASPPRQLTPSCTNELITRPIQRPKLTLQQQIGLFPELSRLEMHFLDVMLHKKIDIDKYIIGPSFRSQHLQAFADQLNAGMPLLKDAFIACASHLVENRDLQKLAQRHQIGYKRAAAAISSLRLAEVHYDEDLTTVLILGVAMVTFALHHIGDTSLLCTHILGLVRSLYDDGYDLMQKLGSDGVAFLICLVSTETEECLVRCRLPTIRIRLGDLDRLVDRFIGVSAPLLTHFYDICELAQRAHLCCRRRGQILLDADFQEARAKIEQTLERWQPVVSVDYLAEHFTPTEVVRMLAQAQILRLAALLVTHRLRSAYGSQDDKALVMSTAILDEIDAVIRNTGRSLPFADLAHLVACFEITSPEERRDALVKSHQVVDFSPHVREEHEEWLVSFWAARDDGSHCIFWHDVGSYIG